MLMEKIEFHDLKLLKMGRNNPYFLEIILFDGINLNTLFSSNYAAYAIDKKSNRPGVKLIGYLSDRGENYIELSLEKLSNERKENQSNLLIRIYDGAIHSILKI